MQRIGITGASGFIGRALCAHVRACGHEVVAIVRPGQRAIEGASATLEVADLAFLGDESTLFASCDTVIHLAGRAHVLDDTCADPLAQFRRVNVAGTRQVVRAAINSGVKRVVFVSSIGVHGQHTAAQAFCEADQAHPHDLYAISKWEAEQALWSDCAAAGMQAVVVRPALVFAAHAPGNFARLLALAAAGVPLPFAAMRGKRNVLGLRNLVDFLRLCALDPRAAGETFVIADREEVTLPEMLALLRKGMGKRARLFAFPGAVLHGVMRLAGRGGMYAKLNGELRIDSGKAAKVLDWRQPYSSQAELEAAGRAHRRAPPPSAL